MGLNRCLSYVLIAASVVACNSSLDQPTWSINDEAIILSSPDSPDQRIAAGTANRPEGYAGYYTETSQQPNQRIAGVLLLTHPDRWTAEVADELSQLLGIPAKDRREAEKRSAKWTFAQLFSASQEFHKRSSGRKALASTVDIDEKNNAVRIAVQNASDSARVSEDLVQSKAPGIFVVVVEPPACVSLARPLVRLIVIDSVTGTNITDDAWAVITSSSRRDSVHGSPAYPVTALELGIGAGFDAGFTITAGHAGYHAWSTEFSSPTRDPCGYTSSDVVAALNRL